MTTTEERPRATRPAAGVGIDPRRLVIMRSRRGMRRRDVAEAIAALGWTDDDGRPLAWKQDVVGKYENGTRRPSMAAFRALVTVLGCDPLELMPGGPELAMPEEARVRENRLGQNRELRRFAVAHGLRYKNRVTGRVYYRRELRRAYEASLLLDQEVRGGDQDRIAAARAELEAALARAPKDPAGS